MPTFAQKGQYGRVIGYIEPIEEELFKKGVEFEFKNHLIGQNIPPEFIPSCEKGAKSASEKGALAGYLLSGVRVVLTDGQSHVVDSNDMAFQLAMQYAIREAVKNAQADVPLAVMFGYSTDLRSSTQGKGEFTMEYKDHQPVPKDTQEELIKKFQEKLLKEQQEK